MIDKNEKNQNEHSRVFKFTIDNKPHESAEQIITGAVIRRKGNIPSDYSIYLKIHGPGDDQLIKDDEKVDLGKPGTEHFFSCKPNTNNG